MKNVLKVLLMLVVLLMGVNPVNAVEMEEIDFHGLYCEYSNENTDERYYLSLHAYYLETQMSLETDDFSAELGHIVDDSMTDPEIVDYFLEKEIFSVGKNGNYYWSCPTDSSKLGIPGLKLITKGCYNGSCDTSITPSVYESYTCDYKSRADTNLKISFVSNEEFKNGKWNITYPDGSKRTFVGTEINGNFMPSSKCEDIYYITTEKRIQVALDANEGISDNLTLEGLCDYYSESEIEHFCSGNCKYSETTCAALNDVNGCPKVLAPAFRIIKKILMPIIKIGIPIVLILLGTIDLTRAVTASDDKTISEATSRFIKRCLAAIIVFFVATIVSAIMNMFSATNIGAQNDWQACWNLED